jgi:hypothetical protein
MRRITKTEVIECFLRRDRSYRLGYLCTYWLRNTAPFEPSAAAEARGLVMEVRDTWISFGDLADRLELLASRDILVSEFLLTHLYALICQPFEILRAYCNGYDQENPERFLSQELRKAAWYQFARIVRNALSHDFHFHFPDREKRKLPVTWNSIIISEDMDGEAMTHHTLWHKTGYELFTEMRTFANALPHEG